MLAAPSITLLHLDQEQISGTTLIREEGFQHHVILQENQRIGFVLEYPCHHS